jgi:PTS system N-acetylglucosamine-specific IIB component
MTWEHPLPRDPDARQPGPDARRTGRDQEDTMSKAEDILRALGGAQNVEDIEGCITRLRTEVADSSVIDEPALKAAGAHGVMVSGGIVQVVVGPEAENLAEDIQDLL